MIAGGVGRRDLAGRGEGGGGGARLEDSEASRNTVASSGAGGVGRLDATGDGQENGREAGPKIRSPEKGDDPSVKRDESPPCSHPTLPCLPAFSPPAPPKPMTFGEDHPDREKSSKSRVMWTAAEVDYIAQWCTRDTELHPERGTLVARCRKAILQDPAARRIFHQNHVVDSARLRAGYDKFLKREANALQEFGLDGSEEGDLDFGEIFEV